MLAWLFICPLSLFVLQTTNVQTNKRQRQRKNKTATNAHTHARRSYKCITTKKELSEEVRSSTTDKRQIEQKFPLNSNTTKHS
jgi:uncharacterized protein YpmS